jgi:lipopolysaccharide heptosyltransferase II
LGENFNNILIIDLAYIGDLLMATPAISEIKRHYPTAHIAVMCSPTSAEVLQRNPAIDKIITFEKRPVGLWKYVDMARNLRREGFDVAFIFHRSFGSAMVAFLAGIKQRVGFNTEGRRLLLTRPVHFDTSRHRADNNLAVLQAFGLDINPDPEVVFVTDPADESFPEEILGEKAGERKYIVFNPNGSWETKRWPSERFAELVTRVEDDFGLLPVGIGSEGDRKRTEDALDGRGVNLAGRTSLSQLGVLCRKAALVVTNDSGPMHIAAAVGAKVIALFGPTDPGRCGPRSHDAVVVRRKDLDCIACYEKKCPIDFPCMLGIQVEEMFGLVKEALAGNFAG